MEVQRHGREPHISRDMGVALRAARPHALRAGLELEAEWKRRAARHRRTGTYMRSITHAVTMSSRGLVVRVGSLLHYAEYLERGTGLYGPHNQRIVPVHKKALAWPVTVGKGTAHTLTGRARTGASAQAVRANMAFAASTKGMRPLRIAHDAALVAQPRVIAHFRAGGKAAAHALAGLAGAR